MALFNATRQAFFLGLPLTEPHDYFVHAEPPLMAVAGAPTVTPTGTTGAATWTYKIVAKQSDGRTSAASATGTTATGNATLTGGNYNAITWTAVAGAYSYDIYRTVAATSPTTLGKIGNTTTLVFNDTGVAGDGTTAPTTNAAGPPGSPLFPDGLTSPQQANVNGWRNGTVLYSTLAGAEITKADQYIAFFKALTAWQTTNRLARESQWHWARVDSAIMNYATVPPSKNIDGTSSNAPGHPVVIQEPV